MNPGLVCGDGRSVLVVDDEIGLLKLMISTLEHFGFTAIGASSAEEALELMSPTLHAVITDLNMPGKNGNDVGKAAKSIREDMLVILFYSPCGMLKPEKGVHDITVIKPGNIAVEIIPQLCA